MNMENTRETRYGRRGQRASLAAMAITALTVSLMSSAIVLGGSDNAVVSTATAVGTQTVEINTNRALVMVKKTVKAGQACTKVEATKKTQVTVVNKEYQCFKQKVRGKTVYRWVLIATYDLSTGPMPQDTPATTKPSIPAKVAPTADWAFVAPTSIRYDGIQSCRIEGNNRIFTVRFAVTGGSFYGVDDVTKQSRMYGPTDTYYAYVSGRIFSLTYGDVDETPVNVAVLYLPRNYDALVAYYGNFDEARAYGMDTSFAVPASSLC